MSSLSHLTERHSIYLLKLPLPEAEDSSNTLLVPYWCHLILGSALIIFHLSSNSRQTDCCLIFSIISFNLSCFRHKLPQLHTTIVPIRNCIYHQRLLFHLYEFDKYQRLPFHIYELVENIRNHELPGYFQLQRYLPSCGRNEYMVLFHYNHSG